jgi:hypothetical protein
MRYRTTSSWSYAAALIRGSALKSTVTPSEVHSLNFVMSPSWQQVRIISSDTHSSASLAAEHVVAVGEVMLGALVVLMLVSSLLCIIVSLVVICGESVHAWP